MAIFHRLALRYDKIRKLLDKRRLTANEIIYLYDNGFADVIQHVYQFTHRQWGRLERLRYYAGKLEERLKDREVLVYYDKTYSTKMTAINIYRIGTTSVKHDSEGNCYTEHCLARLLPEIV